MVWFIPYFHHLFLEIDFPCSDNFLIFRLCLTVIEADYILGKTVDIRGLIDSGPTATDGSGSMIIGDNEDNVRSLIHIKDSLIVNLKLLDTYLWSSA